MKLLAILAVLLVASCAGQSAYAAPRCSSVEAFVTALDKLDYDHVVLRGDDMIPLLHDVTADPDADVVTLDPDSIIVAVNPLFDRAMVGLVRNGRVCDRIAAPKDMLRQYLRGA